MVYNHIVWVLIPIGQQCCIEPFVDGFYTHDTAKEEGKANEYYHGKEHVEVSGHLWNKHQASNG